jgi:hypothetical protein
LFISFFAQKIFCLEPLGFEPSGKRDREEEWGLNDELISFAPDSNGCEATIPEARPLPTLTKHRF